MPASFKAARIGAGQAVAVQLAVERGAEADDLGVECARRACACSSSSSTNTPAPSPMTKPSRSRSNGRHALSGASLRCDSGSNRHWRTMLSGLSLLSAPPTRKKSA